MREKNKQLRYFRKIIKYFSGAIRGKYRAYEGSPPQGLSGARWGRKFFENSISYGSAAGCPDRGGGVSSYRD